MASLKEVYNLVQALDKNEKKNLSILIEALGGKAKKRYANSLRIFNDQKEFDAEKLKQKLGPGVAGMSLTEANDYFFAFVCKSLLSNQTHATANLGLLKDIILVEIFISKGLFDTAQKQLLPLLTRLEEGNSFGLLSRGLELQSIIYASLPKSIHDYKKRSHIIELRKQATVNQLQFIEVHIINHRFMQTVHEIGNPREKNQLAAYEKIYAHPIWQMPLNDINSKTFLLFAPVKIDLLGLVKGRKEAIAECKKLLIEFYKRYSLTNHYVTAFYLLDNLTFDCVAEKDLSEFPFVISELRKLLNRSKQVAVSQKIYNNIVFLELSKLLMLKDYADGIQKFEQYFKPEEKRKWNDAPLSYIIYILGARLYYLNGNPSKALDYLLLLQGSEKEFRAPMQIAYRFLFLLCYYKMENYSLVTSTADSIYKSLLKHKKLYEPERAILRFVKSTGTKQKMRDKLVALYHTLHQLSQNPFHESFFLYADYLEWLELELTKKK